MVSNGRRQKKLLRNLRSYNEEETFDMDQPLSEMPRRPLSDLPSKIQDRMSRLQSFQYQFKANLQNLSDAERVPAYLRQGMEVDLDQKSKKGSESSDARPEGVGGSDKKEVSSRSQGAASRVVSDNQTIDQSKSDQSGSETA